METGSREATKELNLTQETELSSSLGMGLELLPTLIFSKGSWIFMMK
jgi:hypothetical protein